MGIITKLSLMNFTTIIGSALTSRCLPNARRIHTTATLYKKKAGRNKPTRKHDKPLTYEQANQPFYIGVRKSWNSWNTGGFEGSLWAAETSHEDILIRKFIHGTWINMLESEVVIKRRANCIFLSYITNRDTNINQINFLIGYTEEILSLLLKSNVKIELQTIDNKKELIYKYI